MTADAIFVTIHNNLRRHNTRSYFILLLSLFCITIYSCKEESASGEVSDFQKNYEEALMIHDDIGDVDASIKYLDSSFSALAPTDLVERFRYYEFHYNSYRRNYHNNEKALVYADSMIDVFKDNKSEEYLPHVSQGYSSKGDALLALGKYEDAFTSYFQAKEYAASSQNICVIGDFDYRLGMVLYKQERYLKASEYFKTSMNNLQSCEKNFMWFFRKQEVIDNIGLCYYHLGENDTAIHYYQKALAYINENYAQFPAIKRSLMNQAIAVVYGNLATAYHTTGKTAEAKELLRKSIAINSLPAHDKYDAQISRLKLANYYLDESNTGEAKIVLDEIKKISDTLKSEFVALGFEKTMSEYYELSGDDKKALAHLTTYINLKDSSDIKKKNLLETDINARFENLKKEQEIVALAESNKRKQEYLILLIVGALMSIAIGILIVRNWRKSRQNVMILSKLNKHVKDQNIKNEETLGALAKSNKEKDRILQAVSHDIRNPILAVSSLAELMEIDIDSFPEEQKEYILLIKEACTHALNISNDLIEISASKQVTELEKEYTDLTAILKSCINLLRFRAAQKNQQLTLSSQQDASIDIYANKEKIIRVISNIITNAIKFTPEGGLISIGATADSKEAVITITDEGIGIPEEYKDKIFDMFTEAKRPGTEGEKPFGLGLSISKQIVEAHKGKIWFDSKPNIGTTFYISIPLN